MSSDRSPALAALLSLIFPGLGQIYAGAVRRGLAWTLPTVALILLAIVIIVGKISLVGLVTTQATLAIIALQFALLFYHIAAMVDAYGIAQRERRMSAVATSGASAAALVGLVVLALLIHALPIYETSIGNDFLASMFPGRPHVIPSVSFAPESQEPIPSEQTDSPEPTASGNATPGPTATGRPTTTPAATPSEPPQSFPPLANPWGERVNLLLIGSDAGPGRPGGRTDTMILLSVEVNTGKAALFGFPRNMNTVPLPEDANGNPVDGRLWTDPHSPGYGDPAQSLLTNLFKYAWENPGKFYTPPESCPGGDPTAESCSDARAFRATTAAIQNLAGVQIHGVIAVNLSAFRNLVDAVGGIWIDVPDAIYDDAYPSGDDPTGQSPHIIDIPKGCNWFNGIYALAYARSRHQDSDYRRMRRQQEVLQAVRRQFDPLALLPRLNELLQVASTNMWTTIDRNTEIPILAQIASRVDADRMYQVRITPGAGYPSQLTASEIRSIRSRVQNIFSQPQPEPTPRPSNKPQSCPAPGQTPGPSFNTKPSPKP